MNWDEVFKFSHKQVLKDRTQDDRKLHHSHHAYHVPCHGPIQKNSCSSWNLFATASSREEQQSPIPNKAISFNTIQTSKLQGKHTNQPICSTHSNPKRHGGYSQFNQHLIRTKAISLSTQEYYFQ